MFRSEGWLAFGVLRPHTDAASTKGFAAVFGGQLFMHAWPDEFNNLHINILELLPIVLEVEFLGAEMSNQRILFLSDNIATVYVLNKMTSKDPV